MIRLNFALAGKNAKARWSKPTRRGFGSILIEKVLAAEFGGSARLDFTADGVAFALKAPLDKVSGTGDATTVAATADEPAVALRAGNRVLVVEDEALPGHGGV